MITVELTNRADALIAAVEAQYRRTEDELTGFIWDSDKLANLRAERRNIDQWRTTLRRFAEQGHKDTGTAYSWTEWADHAGMLMDAIRYYAQISGDSTTLALLRDTIKATAAELADIGKAAADVANIASWSTSTKLLVGLGLAAFLVFKLQ